MRPCTTSRADPKRGHPDVYQCNMTSGLSWIIRACLFQVCLWRGCLCEGDCPYNQYWTDIVKNLPKDYYFKINKSEENTFEKVEKTLSRFYGNNCKEEQDKSALYYLLGCLNNKQKPTCVSYVEYSLAEVKLVSLKRFEYLVKAAFNDTNNVSQDKECVAVFECDAVFATTATATTATAATTTATAQPSSSLTSSPLSNCSNMELQVQRLQKLQVQRLQSGNIIVSTLLAFSLIANIILGVYLWTRGRRQHEGLSAELEILNSVEVRHLIQKSNGDALQH